jgi:hypothetical protein
MAGVFSFMPFPLSSLFLSSVSLCRFADIDNKNAEIRALSRFSEIKSHQLVINSQLIDTTAIPVFTKNKKLLNK